MAQYQATLESMRGHVRLVKPTVTPQLVDDWLNQGVRQALDVKAMWAGSIKHAIIAISAAYTTGSISLATNSNIVQGFGTSWPINDAVNSALTATVQVGERRIQPTSMTGITADTVLYVDSGNANAEIVGVLDVNDVTFTARFARSHAPGAPIWSSSLAGRQLRQSNQAPIFTVLAVLSQTQMIIDVAWGGAAISNGSYELLKMYTSVATDIKEFLSVTDTARNRNIKFHGSLADANRRDPARQTGGPPVELIDMRPNYCGNMQYEIYPPQRDQCQLDVMYFSQWKQMVSPSDRPPHFINPDCFTKYAIAQALRTKTILDPSKPDPYYDLQASDRYLSEAGQALAMAINADAQKAQLALTYQGNDDHRGADYWQSHDPDVEYGGRW